MPAAAACKIFIIGTGRSGTHWVGQILASHPDIHVTVEQDPMFRWAITMALHPNSRAELLPQLIKCYRDEHDEVLPRHYADKSHPNIWIAQELSQGLPDALFLAIERNPYATIASMLQHKGVQQWFARWREFPVPNRFLGLTAEIAPRYDTLSLSTKCALRWLSHHEELVRLSDVLGPRLLVLEYDRLQTDTARELDKIESFVGLQTPLPAPEIKTESLDAWRTSLNADDQAAIKAVIDKLA